MIKISDCFHYIINLSCYVMKLAGMICKLDMQVYGKFTDCAVQFANWQIGQIGRLDGTYIIHVNLFISRTKQRVGCIILIPILC